MGLVDLVCHFVLDKVFPNIDQNLSLQKYVKFEFYYALGHSF